MQTKYQQGALRYIEKGETMKLVLLFFEKEIPQYYEHLKETINKVKFYDK